MKPDRMTRQKKRGRAIQKRNQETHTTQQPQRAREEKRKQQQKEGKPFQGSQGCVRLYFDKNGL